MSHSVVELPERMQNKITTSDGGCWVWTAAVNNKGYGQVGVNGKVRSTHRVTYELLVGPIPEGLQIDHLCRNRACCNPAHLEPVTAKVNAERIPRSPYCPSGHPLAGANLIVRSRKPGQETRCCRLCQLLDQRRRREERGTRSAYDKSAHHAFLIADGERVLAELAEERGAA